METTLLNHYAEETIKEDRNIQKFWENSRERYENFKKKEDIYTLEKAVHKKTNNEVDI